MILSLIKFLIIFYIFWIVFATITWNYRPTMYVNAKYNIASDTDINTLEENAVYVCQHVPRLSVFEQMIMCEDVKKSKIKFNIVARGGGIYQKFFKELPKFTSYDLIMIKDKGKSNVSKVIKEKLIKDKENILFFLSQDKDRTGIYHILKDTKKPLVFVNMIETKNKDSIFNKKFDLLYRVIENYPIDMEPKDFIKWIKDDLYGYYENLETQINNNILK